MAQYRFQQEYVARLRQQQSSASNLGSYDYSNAYEDANYGYTGMYVDQGDYNYYFRQGFQRGYQDGYNARLQYGRNDNGRSGIPGEHPVRHPEPAGVQVEPMRPRTPRRRAVVEQRGRVTR